MVLPPDVFYDACTDDFLSKSAGEKIEQGKERVSMGRKPLPWAATLHEIAISATQFAFAPENLLSSNTLTLCNKEGQ